MFGIKVSAVERRLFALLLWLGGLGISVPLSLASHLFTSSVRATEHLVKFAVGFEIFELDSHFDCVSFNMQFHSKVLLLMKSLINCLLYLILCSNGPF